MPMRPGPHSVRLPLAHLDPLTKLLILRRAPLSYDWYGLRRQALAQFLREVLLAVLRRLTSAPACATQKTVLKNRCNRQFGFYIDGYSISINQNNYIK